LCSLSAERCLIPNVRAGGYGPPGMARARELECCDIRSTPGVRRRRQRTSCCCTTRKSQVVRAALHFDIGLGKCRFASGDCQARTGAGSNWDSVETCHALSPNHNVVAAVRSGEADGACVTRAACARFTCRLSSRIARACNQKTRYRALEFRAIDIAFAKLSSLHRTDDVNATRRFAKV